MNQQLKAIQDFIQQNQHLDPEEKASLLKYLKDADKSFSITEFKLDRTEKVKRTTAILLEETIEELEKKRKAVEAQNRELEIETSLERVRAVAMSMMKADDLLDICKIQFNELKQLGFAELRNALIGIFYDADNYFMDYDFSDFSGGIITKIPYHKNEVVDRSLRQMKSATDAFTEFVVEGDELEEWKAFQKQNGAYDNARVINILYYYFYSVGNGNVGISTYKKINEDELSILKKFRNVFDLAYTRYVDIVNAEAQTREAKIEAALERVRTKTMAMRSSNDIAEAVTKIFDELLGLGVGNSVRCGISIFNNSGELEIWTASTNTDGKPVLVIGKLDKNVHSLLQDTFTAWENKETEFTRELSGEALRGFYNALNAAPGYPFKFNTETLPAKRINNTFYFPEGALYAYTDDVLPEDARQLFKRFASAFSLTYRRYFDLQKAEAQAREATIETALERVRSRTLAMQKSVELSETAAVLFKQLIGLGIAPNRLYIGIVNNESGAIEFWITDEDGSKITTMFYGNAYENISLRKMYDGWKQEQKSIVIDMSGQELADYFHYLGDELHVSFKSSLLQKRRLQYIAYFSNGFIGMASPGEQPKETVDLLERFAYVFNLTFTRFSDLKIAEAHAIQAQEDLIKLQAEKRRAEDALIELRAAQKQLIQSEKMASLGELTAGIAHEIQNPLNFVNNFSDINSELIEELNEEIVKGNSEEVKAILNDLKQNLEKINHHGKRADGIVKGMLLHSRQSKNIKEPTDLNALCDEYLRLSYHGLKAKDKSFNSGIQTNFDTSIEKINVISQDVGRVILNILTNAFYAVNDRLKNHQSINAIEYKPLVTISTKKMNFPTGAGGIEIVITDNGNGIPQDIIDKIFQPFFTTKPTGEGTGLGLSLSYDIIKVHGGEIKVETKEGEGTTFIIQLPVV